MKHLFLSLFFASAFVTSAFAWGKLGHAVVAQVAQNHLTPAAKSKLQLYLHGESLPAVASHADKFRSVWVMDLGFKPSNPDAARVTWLKYFDFSTPINISPISHSITVNKNFVSYATDNDQGRYVNNCAYYMEQYAKELSTSAETMDAEKRYREICLIIHLIGDMHCPQHIVYVPMDTLKGKGKFSWKGKTINYHGFWDAKMVEEDMTSNVEEYAKMIDDCAPAQIKQLTKGNIYKWAEMSAKDSWPAHKYKDGDTLPLDAIEHFRPLAHSQLKKAGYRLAAYLNNIFK